MGLGRYGWGCVRPSSQNRDVTYDPGLGGAEGRAAPADRDARTAALLEQARLATDSALAELLRADAIELNIVLATSIARRYINRGVELDDLRQVALVALVLAIDRLCKATV